MRFSQQLEDIGSIEQFDTCKLALNINVDIESELQESKSLGVRGAMRRVMSTKRAHDIDVPAVNARVVCAALDNAGSNLDC
jgi:hypothetical protein